MFGVTTGSPRPRSSQVTVAGWLPSSRNPPIGAAAHSWIRSAPETRSALAPCPRKCLVHRTRKVQLPEHPVVIHDLAQGVPGIPAGQTRAATAQLDGQLQRALDTPGLGAAALVGELLPAPGRGSSETSPTGAAATRTSPAGGAPGARHGRQNPKPPGCASIRSSAALASPRRSASSVARRTARLRMSSSPSTQARDRCGASGCWTGAYPTSYDACVTSAWLQNSPR